MYHGFKKERKIFRRKFVTRLFWGTIDFYSRKINTIKVNGAPEPLCFPLSSEYLAFSLSEKKDIHTGLEPLEGKWWQNFHFCVNYPFKKQIIKLEWFRKDHVTLKMAVEKFSFDKGKNYILKYI